MADPTLSPAAPPAAILEAALYARDLDAAAHFYGDLIGLHQILRVEKRHVFFRVGAGVLLIFNPDETARPTSNARLPVPPHGTQGSGHVCFTLSRDEIAAMRDRLASAGVAVDAEFDWPNGAHSLYVRDPAGNSVEFAEGFLWDS